MNNTKIVNVSPGVLEVSGELVFDTVVELLEASRQFFDGSSGILINLQNVDKTDSAGLALLVEWIRLANLRKQSVQFSDVPKQLLDIARVSSLDDLLPII